MKIKIKQSFNKLYLYQRTYSIIIIIISQIKIKRMKIIKEITIKEQIVEIIIVKYKQRQQK